MSAGFAAVPNWLVEDPDVTGHEKLVYLVLSSKIGDQGAWFIGHSEIAGMCGISVSSVQRALASLRERGVIAWVERFDEKTNARLGNQYRLMTDRLGQRDLPPRSERPTPPVSVTEQNKNPEQEPIDTPPTPSFDELFDEVWSHWPNKSGKAAAKKKWRSAVAVYRKEWVTIGGEMQSLADMVRRFGKAYRQTTPPQFIPMLSTWLNQERWSDPLPVERTRGTYNPEPLAQAPINDGPYDSTGALNVPRGMKAQYDDDGRFERFVPLGE